MKSLVLVFAVLSIFFLNGCASIVSKSQYPVSITSSPSGAQVTVINHRGIELHKGYTPSIVTLPASKGYFSPARYTVKYELQGHLPTSGSISTALDGWYVANILFGGIIGGLIVDPLTGAMWTLDDGVHANLSPYPQNAGLKASPDTAPPPNDTKVEILKE